MQKNLRFFERAVRVGLGLLLLFCALMVFKGAASRAIAAAIGAFSLFEGGFGFCLAMRNFGVKKVEDGPSAEVRYFIGLLIVQAVIGYEWLAGGWSKAATSGFSDNIGQTLKNFAAKNPYAWYADFLNGFGAQNAKAFALAVQWGELLAGAALIAAVIAFGYVRAAAIRRWAARLSVAALVGGMLMSANFYLAAGWLSPSTKGVNMVMFWAQLALAYCWAGSTLASADTKPAAPSGASSAPIA